MFTDLLFVENLHPIVWGNTCTNLPVGTKFLIVGEPDSETFHIETMDRSYSTTVSREVVKETTMYAVNDVAFDKVMKEHVMITNGKCVLCEQGLVHKDCVFKPYECICIRMLGMKNLKPLLAWTYRHVDPNNLVESSKTREDFDEWMNKLGRV